MNKQKYDLAIAYRIYPKLSKSVPVIKNFSKKDLAELCLKSLKISLGLLKVKIFALLDNCPPEYEDLFRKYFNERDLEIIKLSGIGNEATFNLQVKILIDQNFSEVVYFAEDDYFYFPNQFQNMILFLKKDKQVDFITPYDHRDYYTDELHKNKNYIKVFGNKHWRTVNSTCLTFLTTKSTLRKTKKIFNIYSKGRAADASMWLSLTKYHLFNPFTIGRFLIREPISLKWVLEAWIYKWRQILFGKKWNIWCPIPTIATHMAGTYLSLTIDWEDIFKKEIEKLK